MNPWWILSIAAAYCLMWWMTALKFARAEFRKITKYAHFQVSSYKQRQVWRRQCLIYGMVMALPWPLTLTVSTIRQDFHNHDLLSVIPPTQEEINLLNREREARIKGLERQLWKRER